MRIINVVSQQFNDLPKALASVRRQKGLTVKEVAKKLGLEGTNLSKLEHGHRIPSLKRIGEWADALDVDFFIEIRQKEKKLRDHPTRE